MGPDACTRVFSPSWLSPAGHQHIVECPGWEDSQEENPSIWHSASLWFSALGIMAFLPGCSLQAPLH